MIISPEAGSPSPRYIQLGTRETFALPDDWQLPSPAGETVARFINDAIVGHPLVQALSTRGVPIGLKVPTPVALRVDMHTVDWWKNKYPEDPYSRPGTAWVDKREYYLEWACWRLVVEACDRLRAGDWLIHGCRDDDPEQLSRPVPPTLFGRAGMVLNLVSDGYFKPVTRDGPPSPALTYRALTLHVGTLPPPPVAPSSVIASKGGAPPTYDWVAFNREAFREANLNGFATRADVAAHMLTWVAKTWEKQPDERTLRRRLADLYYDDLPE